MARLKSGEYQVHFFDVFGERLKNARQVYATCLTRSIVKGRRYAKSAGYNSFRVDRAVYNSLDPHK